MAVPAPSGSRGAAAPLLGPGPQRCSPLSLCLSPSLCAPFLRRAGLGRGPRRWGEAAQGPQHVGARAGPRPARPGSGGAGKRRGERRVSGAGRARGPWGRTWRSGSRGWQRSVAWCRSRAGLRCWRGHPETEPGDGQLPPAPSGIRELNVPLLRAPASWDRPS